MRTLMLLIVVGLVASAIAHAANAASSWPSDKQVDTKSYDISSTGSVAVDNASGDVSVVGWDQDQVQITETKTAWSDDDLARLQTQVDSQADSIGIRASYPDSCFNCDISYDIRVPRGSHITVASSSGDVTIKSVSGPVRVDSSSGDVEIDDASGAAHLHSSSGDMTIDGAAASVEGVSSSGDIDASGLQSNTDLVSASGDVKAAFSSFGAVKTVRLESSSGDVTFTVPRGAGFRVDASTGSGSIDSDLALPVHDDDSGADVAAQVGNGGANVQLRSTSGDIHVTMR